MKASVFYVLLFYFETYKTCGGLATVFLGYKIIRLSELGETMMESIQLKFITDFSSWLTEAVTSSTSCRTVSFSNRPTNKRTGYSD
jgi:hypothetical protein